MEWLLIGGGTAVSLGAIAILLAIAAGGAGTGAHR